MQGSAQGFVRQFVSPRMYKAGLLSLFLLLLAGTARAQVSTASVNGVVRDSAGAVVPGAAIVLQNVDTSVEHPTVSNNTGGYVILNVTPGRYTLSATAKGFNPQKTAEFVLAVSQIATFDFALAVGSDTQVVTVDATATQLDVSGASLGTVIEAKQVNELPLNGRNFTALLALTPGVVPIMTGQSAGMSGNGGFGAAVAIGADYSFPAINGQTNRSNFYLMDGLYNYSAIESTYAVAPIIDALQEFKVVSHTDSAEYGAVLGGVVNVVTKSGTNEYHGSGWEYLRNKALDASPYFVQEPAFHQNTFGASVGGPVWIPKLYNGKNKSFFFGAYQGYRYSQTSKNTIFVPTAEELAGNIADNHQLQIYNPFETTCVKVGEDNCGTFSRPAFAGNQIPQNLIDQRMVAYAKFVFPAAGPCLASSNGVCTANAIDNTPLTQKQDEFNIRGDQNFGPKDSAWFRYSFINSKTNSSGGLPGLLNAHEIDGRNWGGSFVHIFSPTQILQLQYARVTVTDNQATRFTASTADILSTVGFSDAFASGFAGLNGGALLPGPGISNYQNGGESIDLTPKANDTHEVRGTYTRIMGRHEVKFGAGYDTANFASPLSQIGLNFGAAQTGDPESNISTGDGLASFLLNVPSGASRRNVNEQERPGGLLSAFLQDSWKTTRRLSLNYGLRYDYPFLPAYGTSKTVGQQGGPETGDMDFTSGNYIIQKLPPLCSVRGFAPCIPDNADLSHVIVSQTGKINHNVHTNFGPRFGFAYKASEKTVVHGAFGIVFDDWAGVTQLAQNIEGAWPDIGQQIASSLTNVPTSTQQTPNVTSQNPFAASGGGLFPATTPFTNNQWYYDPHLKNPYSEQWNFGIQQQLSGSLALRMDYVGSGSHRTIVGGLYNTALTPGPGDIQPRAPYPYQIPTFYDRSIGTASYNALQVQLDKRYTSGFSYQVAYTWSKSLSEDDGWFGVEGQVVQDPYNPKASRGLAGANVPHVLSINALYEIPIGHGRRFSTNNKFFDYVLGNWQINNIFTWRNGQDFTATDGLDRANIGGGGQRANQVGNPHQGSKTLDKWFNTNAFALPALYTFGNAGRNTLQAQRVINLDTSIIRSFPFWREKRIEFRAEAFNLANHPIFGIPNHDVSSNTFGAIGNNNQENASRQMQMTARIVF
jgi:hypothetical protein